MERALRRLLRVSPIIRNWTVLPNYVAPLQNILQICKTISTDHVQLEDTEWMKRNHYMLSKSKITNNPMRILESAASNYTNMTVHSAIETMTILFKSSKRMKNMESIKKHIGFMHTCDVLSRDIRLMKIGDVIESLKILTYFKIPSNTLLIQSLLQIIRTNVNEISLRNIIFIIFLLKQMQSTPLRDALLIALPLVFEAQLPSKLDKDDIVLLMWCLRFISEQRMKNQDMQDIIFNALHKYRNNMDLHVTISVLYSLCHMPYLSATGLQVLSNMQEILSAKAKELSIPQIMKTLDRITSVITKNKEQGNVFYNETLIDALINSAIHLNVNFADGIYLLKLLNDLNYAYIPFLEYLSAKCFEEPNLLKDASYFKMCALVEGFVNADYKPVFWDTIRDAILMSKVENKSFNKSLIKFALHLTALDCYSPRLLDTVFQQEIENTDTMRIVYATEMLALYQSIKTMYPMYSGAWPSQDLLEYAVTLKPITSEFSLRAALERALGGPQYVHNDLRTKLGHYIDHVVVMRKGGFPVAINTHNAPNYTSNTIYVEDIHTPSESQLILIFNFPNSAYAVNSQRLKSTWLLKTKSAEILTRSSTIAINSSSWLKLSEYEKVPYLMQAIKLKCEDILISAN